MKKGLLATTALIGAGVLMAGTASAAEAPEYKLGGNMNFNVYWADQEGQTGTQDHGWYFGIDETELVLNVSGAADNGLKYGFKIEIQTNTTDGTVADEARIQLSGDWGTLQLGDEDGAEDIMNYGGENLMGGGGGFDGGDYGDIYIDDPLGGAAPTAPNIEGDSSDATKVSYFSPRFSGFQVGASITPQPGLDGDDFKEDGDTENHYGLGANYDNSFGDLHLQLSAVYSASSRTDPGDSEQDVSAWSVGGIVGFGAFSIGANYTDNGDSDLDVNNETSYWNVAGQFKTGPFKVAVGYFASVREFSGGAADDEFTNISLNANYTMAPGLGVYAGLSLIEDDDADDTGDQDATILVVGAKVSF